MALQKQNDNGKYEGKYVAYDPSCPRRVIASGVSSRKVVDRARGKGVAVPVIVYVPRKGAAYIY